MVPVWCMSTISLVWSSSWAMSRDLMMSSVTRPARVSTTDVGLPRCISGSVLALQPSLVPVLAEALPTEHLL